MDVNPEQTKMLRDVMPLAAHLEMEAVGDGSDGVRARIGWRPELCTGDGILHGGVIMTLADSVAATCAFLSLPEGSTGTTTIESKTNFFRAVRDGHIEAHAEPLHVGRSTIVLEVVVVDAAGKLVAKTTQTQAVLYPS